MISDTTSKLKSGLVSAIPKQRDATGGDIQHYSRKESLPANLKRTAQNHFVGFAFAFGFLYVLRSTQLVSLSLEHVLPLGQYCKRNTGWISQLLCLGNG